MTFLLDTNIIYWIYYLYPFYDYHFCEKLNYFLINCIIVLITKQLTLTITVNMTVASKSIDIYIPRILGYINKNFIITTFNNMNIGCVSKIDMFYRKNSSNKEYYFAFITILLYNTNHATKFVERLNINDKFQFNYDEESNNYWDVQLYIPRNKRLNSQQISSHVNVQIPDKNDNVNQIVDKNVIENLNEQSHHIIIQPPSHEYNLFNPHAQSIVHPPSHEYNI